MTTNDEILDELRPLAFEVAYRMLGSAAEAEDVAQEGLVRLHAALSGGEEVRSPRAFLATVVTRLAIDELRSARARRETYVGEWLPEPILTDDATDPAARAEMADSLSVAFLVLLETLSPEQRAALLLRDVFGYGYDEVASVVGTSEANARQLAARARKRVGERRPRFATSREKRDELADRFFAAVEKGDVGALEAMLAADVELHGDGGGKVPALARALRGRARVARTLRNWMRQGERAGVRVRRTTLNGQPGALVLDPAGRTLGAMTLDIAGDEVQGVYSVVNPDKLVGLGPVGDVWAFLSGERDAG